jgi:hypothetical protein
MQASEGSTSRWTRGELKLNAGDNEVLLNTRPGNSGGWFVELRIGEKAFNPADLSY